MLRLSFKFVPTVLDFHKNRYLRLLTDSVSQDPEDVPVSQPASAIPKRFIIYVGSDPLLAGFVYEYRPSSLIVGTKGGRLDQICCDAVYKANLS